MIHKWQEFTKKRAAHSGWCRLLNLCVFLYLYYSHCSTSYFQYRFHAWPDSCSRAENGSTWFPDRKILFHLMNYFFPLWNDCFQQTIILICPRFFALLNSSMFCIKIECKIAQNLKFFFKWKNQILNLAIYLSKEF